MGSADEALSQLRSDDERAAKCLAELQELIASWASARESLAETLAPVQGQIAQLHKDATSLTDE